MIAAIAPIGESRPSNSTSTSEANRIVAMVMPETGLLDEPTSPARYADTETNRKPATIMMIVIGMLTIHWSTMAWYSRPSGTTKATSATSIHFIGRTRSVSATTVPALLRAAAQPPLMHDASDLRSENSVHTQPTSIVPTPRQRIFADQNTPATSCALAPATPPARAG